MTASVSLYPAMRAEAGRRLRLLGLEPDEAILGIAQHAKDIAHVGRLFETILAADLRALLAAKAKANIAAR